LSTQKEHDMVSGPDNDASATLSGVVTKTSPSSVTATVARLVELVEGKGMKVFALIEHSGEAERAGMTLRETKVVIFGSPKAGTPVMQAVALAALDLPLRVLVWDDDGHTRVSYTAPEALAERYGIPAALAANLSGIDALTDSLVSD
jgi:uncharacterized protein (DUF302 family)